MRHCPTPSVEEFELPDSEALHAATLALMTGHAQQTCPKRRCLMARKIQSNLFFLSEHPDLSEELRRVVKRLHGMWVALVNTQLEAKPSPEGSQNGTLPSQETRLWHPAATLMQ